MKPSLKTLYCASCGGTNIRAQAWVDANTKEPDAYGDAPAIETNNGWCQDCLVYVEFCTISELWNRFADIPINDNDEIGEDFLCFEAGTYRFDVWHWFDERCPNGLAVDLMGVNPKIKDYDSL